MESTRVENYPPPPGVISSIRAGFDAIATHISVILLPLLLDLFFWLGPRLRVDALFDSVKDEMVSVWKTGGIPAGDIAQALDVYQRTIPSINLFWILRTLPIGISSLLSFQVDTPTPLGNPSNLHATWLNLLGWIFLLTAVGWVGGGLYFRSVAWLASNTATDRPISAARAITQTMILSVTWGLLSFIIGMPVLLFIAALAQLSNLLAQIAVLFFSLGSMWVIVPLFFWPHGVFLKRQNFLMSIVSSVQLARFTLPTSSMFILTVVLLSMGLNYLWTIPSAASWMRLVGIFGHAFVSTSLLASSFFYYRDMSVWLQNIIDRLRAATPRRA